MALLPKTARDSPARLVAVGLAAGVPLAAYLATASGYAYWLDGGEFVGATAELGISHPPGHPVSLLVFSLLSLVPIGSLDFRIAIASALCAAVAAGFLFLSIETTVRSLGVRRDVVVMPLAIGATWLVAGSSGFWFQAVRPEVYALEAALAFIALERVVWLESQWPTVDVRPLYIAFLALGFGLANHHFLAILIFPALAPTLARVKRAKGNRPLLLCFAALLPGLATYAYLPVRASAGNNLNLGDPDSLDRFFWVLSAQAFQKNPELSPQPLGDRFLDVAVQLVDSLHFAPLLLACAGFYALLRAAGTHRIGYVWLSTLVVHVAARAWLGFVRDNPDAAGYLMPALGAIGAASAAFIAAVLGAIGRASEERPRKTAIAIAWVALLLGGAQLQRGAVSASLASFRATDSYDDSLRRELPPRAVVLAYQPQTVFRWWGGESSERLRPDVTFVAVPFLAYPGFATELVTSDGDLRDLVRTYVLQGGVGTPEIESLAAERPVLVELDVRVALDVFGSLVPYGLYHQALSDRAYIADRETGAEREAIDLGRLYQRLGDETHEIETTRRLLWTHYMAALFYAHAGDRGRAREQAQRALAIEPTSPELHGLVEALGDGDGEGEVDVRPFFPRD